mgnify:CR=1 FL=1
MSNWKKEYQVDYHIFSISDGKKAIEYNSLIIEGNSPGEVTEIVEAQFYNIVGFSIDKVSKIWEY